MGIEWYRDLSVTILGFGATAVLLVLMIVALRLQRGANQVLKELKAASILARESAEMVRDGVEPLASLLGMVKTITRGPERSRKPEDKRRR
jgi:formyltetrahydrofolate synthetase